MFRGTEGPLVAEQWTTSIEELLVGARIPEEDKVNMARVQLEDIAKTWWQTEEVRRPACTWETFKGLFLEQFFPRAAKMEMSRKFLTLRQGGGTVDEYAAEFTRLSRFAPRLVASGEDRARMFEEGLSFEIQKQVAPQRYTTYAEVLDSARCMERILQRQRMAQFRAGSKRPLTTDPTPRKVTTPPAKKLTTGTTLVCNYCQKPGHLQKDCRRAKGQCLVCGSGDHQMKDCLN